jgi:uncharacterized protein YbjT (DUF2867 family)
VRVILFGGTGHLGQHIIKEVIRQGYSLTVVVRDPLKVPFFSSPPGKVVSCTFADNLEMGDILQGHDVIISALGKRISPSDRSKGSFEQVDLDINRLILKSAVQNGITKFVYISAFHAELYPTLEYFRVHEQFAAELKLSGLDYAIIKPPSLFSAYLEMIPMAEKGLLFNFGKGDKRTNPIYDGDLAEIVVKAIRKPCAVIEAGGKRVYSRAELSNIIQRQVAAHQKVRTIPLVMLRFLLPIVRLLDKNTYDKLAFFVTVMEVDTIAPALGKTDFAGYIRDEIHARSINPAGGGHHSSDRDSQSPISGRGPSHELQTSPPRPKTTDTAA